MRTAAICAAAALLLAAATGRASAQDCQTGPCHRDVGRQAVIHAPVEEGDCTACHAGGGRRHPEGAGDEFSGFTGEESLLCYGCHAEVQAEITGAPVVHAPLIGGACMACHHPHESAYDSLLVGKTYSDSSGNQPRRMAMEISNFDLCWQCHDKYVAVMHSTTAKTGFRDGTRNLHLVHLAGEEGYLCSACHRPHASAREFLLERPMDWTDDLVGFGRREGGGYCAPGCHEAKVYRRSGGE